MKSWVRPLATITLATASLFSAACATAPVNDGTQYLANGERPSNLPWNSPEKWEGQGALGGLQNISGQGGGGAFGNR